MIAYAKENNADYDFLMSIWDKNNSVRKNRDWELMLGRAVSE